MLLRSQVAKHVNGLVNLNVTSKDINQAKKGPFTRFLNYQERGSWRGESIEELVRQSKTVSVLQLHKDGYWINIEKAVAMSAEQIAELCRDVQRADNHVEAPPSVAFADELERLIGQMKLGN